MKDCVLEMDHCSFFSSFLGRLYVLVYVCIRRLPISTRFECRCNVAIPESTCSTSSCSFEPSGWTKFKATCWSAVVLPNTKGEKGENGVVSLRSVVVQCQSTVLGKFWFSSNDHLLVWNEWRGFLRIRTGPFFYLSKILKLLEFMYNRL